TANRIVRGPLFIAGVFILAAIGTGSSSAQQVTQHAALQPDLQALQDNAKPRVQIGIPVLQRLLPRPILRHLRPARNQSKSPSLQRLLTQPTPRHLRQARNRPKSPNLPGGPITWTSEPGPRRAMVTLSSGRGKQAKKRS